jgi:hypothetical protein
MVDGFQQDTLDLKRAAQELDLDWVFQRKEVDQQDLHFRLFRYWIEFLFWTILVFKDIVFWILDRSSVNQLLIQKYTKLLCCTIALLLYFFIL